MGLMKSDRIVQITICLVATSLAPWILADPLAPSDIPGKTGAFQVKFTERNPLSAPAEIEKRFHAKHGEMGDDYDLSKIQFEVYVPPAPDDNGKYGLLDATAFASGHGFAPEPQRPILDKYHLIWIGPTDEPDDHPAVERIGACLDGLYNAQKAWPIDAQRIYLSSNSNGKYVSGVALFYPDLFMGAIFSNRIDWFSKMQDPKRHSTWNSDNFPRPPEQYFGLAKSRPYFFAIRTSSGESDFEQSDLVYHRGYQASGFQHIKMIKATAEELNVWSTYGPGWLEQGVQFLDSQKDAANKSVATTATAATASSQTPKPKAAASEDPDAAANKALSLAKTYVSAQKYDLARPKLQKLIETYPNSPAAKEAKQVLADIANK
jgi:hypothetical protein